MKTKLSVNLLKKVHVNQLKKGVRIIRACALFKIYAVFDFLNIKSWPGHMVF